MMIGLRPLDGLLSDDEIQKLVAKTEDSGGKVTYRKSREGYDKPYELNITLYDLLQNSFEDKSNSYGVDRFLCAHSIMFALEGIPAIYIQSMFGAHNDIKRFEHTKRNRSINRHIWDESELEEVINGSNLTQQKIFVEIRRLLVIRENKLHFIPMPHIYFTFR